MATTSLVLARLDFAVDAELPVFAVDAELLDFAELLELLELLELSLITDSTVLASESV